MDSFFFEFFFLLTIKFISSAGDDNDDNDDDDLRTDPRGPHTHTTRESTDDEQKTIRTECK